ncbi:OB-fold nucleic acid binding domain-containing protein, partial [Rhizobium ruizarguesonis]
RVFLHDETGELTLVFFRGQAAWLEKQLPVDEEVTVSGKIDWFNGRASIVHVETVADRRQALFLCQGQVDPFRQLGKTR